MTNNVKVAYDKICEEIKKGNKNTVVFLDTNKDYKELRNILPKSTRYVSYKVDEDARLVVEVYFKRFFEKEPKYKIFLNIAETLIFAAIISIAGYVICKYQLNIDMTTYNTSFFVLLFLCIILIITSRKIGNRFKEIDKELSLYEENKYDVFND